MTQIRTRSATNVWIAGFVGAAALHLMRGKQFAAATRWGPNGGWQREIAIWNLGMTAVLLRARRPPGKREAEFLTALTFMAALLCANHLAAVATSPRSRGNWLGVAANAVGIAVARLARD